MTSSLPDIATQLAQWLNRVARDAQVRMRCSSHNDVLRAVTAGLGIGLLVSLWGDAYGHIHQAVVNDNHDPDNTGPVLYTDILVPLVGFALYGVRERLGRR